MGKPQQILGFKVKVSIAGSTDPEAQSVGTKSLFSEPPNPVERPIRPTATAAAGTGVREL